MLDSMFMVLVSDANDRANSRRNPNEHMNLNRTDPQSPESGSLHRPDFNHPNVEKWNLIQNTREFSCVWIQNLIQTEVIQIRN